MALATLGILSLGDMGVGVAKLLVANNYNVITNASGRRYIKPHSSPDHQPLPAKKGQL